MKACVAALGLCIVFGSLLVGCSKDSACEKACDKLYSGEDARICKDGCND